MVNRNIFLAKGHPLCLSLKGQLACPILPCPGGRRHRSLARRSKPARSPPVPVLVEREERRAGPCQGRAKRAWRSVSGEPLPGSWPERTIQAPTGKGPASLAKAPEAEVDHGQHDGQANEPIQQPEQVRNHSAHHYSPLALCYHVLNDLGLSSHRDRRRAAAGIRGAASEGPTHCSRFERVVPGSGRKRLDGREAGTLSER